MPPTVPFGRERRESRGTGRRLHRSIATKLGIAIVLGDYAPGDTLSSEVAFSNALDGMRAHSLDGGTLYHTDSVARTICAFDLAQDGTLSNKRVFLRFERERGYPDGMTTDAEGCLCVAHWGGGRISRFAPDATLLRSIALPAVNTSRAFAGADLDRLFVTSSADGQSEPDAGALFEVDPGVSGLPPSAFAG